MIPRGVPLAGPLLVGVGACALLAPLSVSLLKGPSMKFWLNTLRLQIFGDGASVQTIDISGLTTSNGFNAGAAITVGGASGDTLIGPNVFGGVTWNAFDSGVGGPDITGAGFSSLQWSGFTNLQAGD